MICKLRINGTYIDVYFYNGMYVASLFGQLPLPFDEDADEIKHKYLIELISIVYNKFNTNEVFMLSKHNEWQLVV